MVLATLVAAARLPADVEVDGEVEVDVKVEVEVEVEGCDEDDACTIERTHSKQSPTRKQSRVGCALTSSRPGVSFAIQNKNKYQ